MWARVQFLCWRNDFDACQTIDSSVRASGNAMVRGDVPTFTHSEEVCGDVFFRHPSLRYGGFVGSTDPRVVWAVASATTNIRFPTCSSNVVPSQHRLQHSINATNQGSEQTHSRLNSGLEPDIPGTPSPTAGSCCPILVPLSLVHPSIPSTDAYQPGHRVMPTSQVPDPLRQTGRTPITPNHPICISQSLDLAYGTAESSLCKLNPPKPGPHVFFAAIPVIHSGSGS